MTDTTEPMTDNDEEPTEDLAAAKQAVRSAEKAGTLGLVLHKLFQHTFSVAKEVRSRTEIGASSVSMAAAAVRLESVALRPSR